MLRNGGSENRVFKRLGRNIATRQLGFRGGRAKLQRMQMCEAALPASKRSAPIGAVRDVTFAHLPSFDIAQATGQLATTQRDASFVARKHDLRPS